MRVALLLSVLLACASCRGGSHDVQRHASPSPPPVSSSAPKPIADSVYLAPERAYGARYCLDPDSRVLREIVARGPIDADARFDRRALARDIAALHEVLAKQYAGYPELIQHRSFDVGAFFARWAREVEAGSGDIRFEDGVARQLVELKRALPDKHLMPRGWGAWLARRAELQTAEYQAPGRRDDLKQCRIDERSGVFAYTLRGSEMVGPDGQHEPIITASAQGTSAPSITLQCGADEIVLHRRGEVAKRDTSALPAYEWKSLGEVAVISVRRLYGSPEDTALLERIAEDYDQHRRHRLLVFDFRDNGGGDDGHIFQWVARAKRGVWRMRPSVEIEGALAPCSLWNHLVYSQMAYGDVDAPEAVAAREEERAAWPRSSPPVRHEVFQGVIESEAESPYEGRIIALVNRHSGSSGESAPEVLRSALGAVLVGERSAGFLEYGNLRPFVLPHTGILFSVPTKRNYYDPPAEGVGLAVDAYLDPALLDRPVEELVPLLEPLLE